MRERGKIGYTGVEGKENNQQSTANAIRKGGFDEGRGLGRQGCQRYEFVCFV